MWSDRICWNLCPRRPGDASGETLLAGRKDDQSRRVWAYDALGGSPRIGILDMSIIKRLLRAIGLTIGAEPKLPPRLRGRRVVVLDKDREVEFSSIYEATRFLECGRSTIHNAYGRALRVAGYWRDHAEPVVVYIHGKRVMIYGIGGDRCN